ncbi:HAD-IA family hydrolase [Lichenibacterium dinghuense]|uniref:HAD-IA family hydrolase n=1 Tax=Lichenibacterium dinghuense TaxID=2895977 RepID=UPI001F39210C|nr:HAD-IA family hydrolase [Lichenibacterium sp. 6Y81]
MRLTDFKVLTFDVVGTLIDFDSGVLSAFRTLGGAAAERLDDDAIYAAYMKGREAHGGRSSEVMRDVYRHAAAILGFPGEGRHAEAFQASVLGWQPFADSAEALGRLRRHYRLVAMTNADRVALSAYAHRLGNPFHDTVCVDETGRPKPDPMFFHYSLGRQSASGFRQSDILHTAQSQYHDIGVAHALGYATCWIERRQGLKGYGATPDPARFTTPDFHFPSMKALADAADAAFRAA